MNMSNNQQRKSPVKPYSIEQVNVDFVEKFTEQMRQDALTGRFSYSKTVNYAIHLIRTNMFLQKRLRKSVEQYYIQKAAKKMKRWGISAIMQERRSKHYNEIMRIVRRGKQA